MALSNAIYTILTANANVSSTFGTRIYPAVANMDATLPLIIYEIDDITPSTAIGSYSDFDSCEVSVQVIGTKHSEVETYAGYVRTAMQGYSGTIDTEVISDIQYRNQSPAYDPDWTVSEANQGVAVFIRTLYFTIIRL